MYTFRIPKPIQIILEISSLIGAIWSFFRILDIIYANLGSKYRPTEEFDNLLENLVERIKNEIKI